MTGRIVVAGASMGGLRAAEQLRAAGWTGEITVLGDEPHMPYNRPPLSKEALAGETPFSSLAFTPRASTADVTWRLNTTVTAARLMERIVELDGGERLGYDGLVVATGTRPRRLRCAGPSGPGSGRHTVRTLADAHGLRAALTRRGARVVVIGAGFIGCEVAATATGLGVAEVTVVAPEPLPMLRPLGAPLARELRRRHELRGVRFALGRGVTRFQGGERISGVVLEDGSVLPADVVVEAVGSLPATTWLEGNGLDLSDGVLTDALLRAVAHGDAVPEVVAVGDVARFPNARYDTVARRVEHWSIPGDTAKRAARTLVAALTGAEPDPTPFAPLPTFWSDQHDFRLQSFGAPGFGTADIRILDGDLAGDVVAGYHTADGRLTGVVALGGRTAVAAAARYRARLLQQPALTAPTPATV
ncbi:FAD-dependent oxidoreductase [Streptomyces sp. NA02950]|uniref:NAD(P)/FAD-dependent oxidoreductase n=1 Tax=Streptomyces sp. NA02950 TaxID=2742137 RepID=UPI00158FECF1|nr:FAD-dependent oxidoreductase [Streptomyces sp. NA02950]QKV96700.1 FAD-dependent oxidoreductase [Streptomyces sp. NA02950]